MQEFGKLEARLDKEINKSVVLVLLTRRAEFHGLGRG